MELWDAYDESFNKLEGITLVRGETIVDGIFHIASDVLVKHEDGEYLLMQRDKRKNFGGSWEATAGGSALKGESPLECAKRELKEETGISDGKFTEVGRVLIPERHAATVCYLCETDVDKNSIILQDGETTAYKWVSRDELKNMPPRLLPLDRIRIFINELKKL